MARFQGTGRPAGQTGTRVGANVPGQTPLSRPVPGQNGLIFIKKRTRFPVLEHHFSVYNILFCFRASVSVLEHPFSVLERPFLLCPILSCVPSRFLAVPARPIRAFSCPDLSRPLVRFLACPVVPLSRDNDGTSVPLSRKVSLSHPVGNTSWMCIGWLVKATFAG